MNANNESDLHAQEESATTEKAPLKKEKTRKTRLYTYHSNYNDFDAAHNAIMAGFEVINGKGIDKYQAELDQPFGIDVHIHWAVLKFS